ncbi:hypothetical protein IFT84_13785 [Rhizobium sp. CFBP 8762]|uniref:hypothetical protein n=1 Tax=Rhizobium sp. CFBP 8762 TaxID=2775279 RepID=UPI00177DAC21|nr:hypothetical protein [Rhizobium sp. CFBP 8762]MBD8555578.1 hypothetical protein [Rhizobium sp. CFBP 8762]
MLAEKNTRHELIGSLFRSLMTSAAEARAMRLTELANLLDICSMQAASDWQGIDPDHMTKADFAAIVYASQDLTYQHSEQRLPHYQNCA